MVSEKKKILVQKLTKAIQDHPVIALVNMENLPAKQLQNMREQLRKKEIVVAMARKKLLQLSLKNSKKQNIDALIQKMKGMPALLLSKENPFILAQILDKSKSSAPAKAGQEAPRDIVVPAGPTSFAPGPIISELANVGIKTKVDTGKLTIIEDTIVAKEGDVISRPLAEMLKRLDIQPMEIGLNLVAAWENEIIFEPKQLRIDETEYLNNITTAFQEAFNLSVELAYPTNDNVELLLQKAFRESKTLSLETDFITDLTAEEILAKTERQALALKEEAGIEGSTESKPQEETQDEQAHQGTKRTKSSCAGEHSSPCTDEQISSVEPAEEVKEEPKVEEKKPEPEVKAEAPVEEAPAEEEKQEEKEEEKSEEKPAEEVPEEKKEEPVVEESKDEESDPVEETFLEEEKPEEVEEQQKEEKTEEEAPKEEEKQEEVTEETKVEEEKQETKEDIPSAEDMIKAVKDKFKEEPLPEPKPEEETSASEMIQATKEEFDPNVEKPEPVPSAESLVNKEQKEINEEKKKSEDVEEAENLFEKLKKQGTLREEEN